MLGWRKHKLESRLPGEISITSESEEELKSLLMKVKEESEKVGLKLNISPGNLDSSLCFLQPSISHDVLFI